MFELKVNVNGVDHEIEIEPELRLLDLLREKLKLIGTKEGCGEGECGACTVIMDGRAVNSCLVMAIQSHNKKVLTIEGLEKGGELDPIQQSFLDSGAVQCGYCIPGMVMSAKALLDQNEKPSEDEIKESISGNLCRCTGYDKIIKSVKLASDRIVKEGK